MQEPMWFRFIYFSYKYMTSLPRRRLFQVAHHLRHPGHLSSPLSTLKMSTPTPTNLTLQSTLPLPNTTLTIPRLGFGVYQSPPNLCIQSCLTALASGYRHIDTAQFYANETEVGEAIKSSGLKRGEIFATTKILGAAGSVEKSYRKCVESVEKIDGGSDGGKGYVDLFLIHSPNSGAEKRKEMWLALERLYEEGRAKSIGVSNYGVGQIEEMKGYAKVWPPMVNQIEVCVSKSW